MHCIAIMKYHLLPRLGNSPEMEEIAHDIFTKKIFENENLGYIRKPVPWLNKIADNYVNTKFKKDKRILPLIEDFPYDDYIDHTGNKDLVNQLLKELNKTERQILVLHYDMGYKHKDIAELTGLTYVNVRTISARAIKKLREIATKNNLE